MNVGERIDGRFEIEGTAGRGGASTVYRARDLRDGGWVALKLAPLTEPRQGERFLREAEVLSALRHPHVVRHVAHGRVGSRYGYLAMEWLAGEDLSQRLARGAPSVRETLALLLGVAEGLAAAHSSGVVHRDVKPRNLFLPDGDCARVKLLDFGIARPDDASPTLTGSRTILGTPGYMAPEQAQGDRAIDARADVFALGAVAFECLTGQRAFPGRHRLPVLLHVAFDEVPAVRELREDVPAALEELVAAMLEKAPSARPRDGAEVAALLRRVASGSLEASPSPPPARRAVVLLGRGAAEDADAATVVTSRPVVDDGWLWSAHAAVAPHGGQVHRLADGTVLVLAEAEGGEGAQAEAAVRCALALRRCLPSAPIAVVTLACSARSQRPLAGALQGARELVREGVGDAVRVDAATRAALGEAFEIERDARGFVLRGEATG